jgi:hypothetical protein
VGRQLPLTHESPIGQSVSAEQVGGTQACDVVLHTNDGFVDAQSEFAPQPGSHTLRESQCWPDGHSAPSPHIVDVTHRLVAALQYWLAPQSEFALQVTGAASGVPVSTTPMPPSPVGPPRPPLSPPQIGHPGSRALRMPRKDSVETVPSLRMAGPPAW